MSVITITKNNFESEVMRSDKPVLIDFWAEWCGPCRMVAPVVEQIAGEVPALKVGKLNVDEQSEIAGRYGIRSIPTLMIFKNGKPVKQIVGAQPKISIMNAINSVLS
ncbi:MAG: thioredoxin [Oscillospiraceae bacterium]|nr:thioredoxin [Oscillospiraceae bacterium]